MTNPKTAYIWKKCSTVKKSSTKTYEVFGINFVKLCLSEGINQIHNIQPVNLPVEI